MKVVKIALIAIGVAVSIGVAIAPIGPVPGFFIGGKPAAAPTQWPDTRDVDEIRLRVPSVPPRVVTIWVVEHEGELYVVGARKSGWVSRLGDGGPVDVRIGDSTYPLRAVAVREGQAPVLTAYVDKYRPKYPDIVASFPTGEEAASQVVAFRLERPAP